MRIPEVKRDDLKSVRSAMTKDLIKQLPIRLNVILKRKFEVCCSHNKTSMNAVVTDKIDAYVNKYYDTAIEQLEKASKAIK